MVRVKGYTKSRPHYTAEYASTVKTLNIVSTTMSDNCTAYKESTSCIIWLDENNSLGELECVYPEQVSQLVYGDCEHLPITRLTPVFEIIPEDRSMYIFLQEKHAILLFYNDKTPDKKCIMGDVTFYIDNDLVVAIECLDTRGAS